MCLKTHLGGNAEVAYAQGYCREEKKAEGDANWQETSLENGGGATKEAAEKTADKALEEKRKALREEAIRQTHCSGAGMQASRAETHLRMYCWAM